MEKVRQLLVLSIIFFIRRSLALYGFDCSDQLTNLTTISLLDVGECNIHRPKVDITVRHGQLLQLNDFGMVHTYICRVKITRQITHCGMHSHASRVSEGELSYYKEFTHEECINLQKTGYMIIASTQIMGIPRNGTTHKPITFAGSSSIKGKCSGSTYTDPYGKWESVYVAGWIEITIADYYREVNLDNNKILLPSGISCKFTDYTCVDMDASFVFWEKMPDDTCGASR